MKSKHNRYIIILVCLILAISITAYARYTHIANLSSGLSINASGCAACSGAFTLWDSDNTCKFKIDLQMNDSGWGSLKTWFIDAEDFYNVTKYYYVSSGHYYKVIVTAEVYDANGKLVETQSVTSSTVYY